MHRLFDALRPVIRAVVRAPGAVVLGALLLSALGLYGALRLPIDTDLSKLIPQSYPSVQALERLRETVGAETTVDVGIQSPSFEANRAFAEVLIAQALDLRGRGADEPYFTRAEFFRDTEFVKDNALYFATSQELDELEAYLDAQIEQARLEANPFYFDLDDEEDEDAAEADSAAARMLAAYDAIVGQEYLVSPDSTTLVVRLYPSGSQTNIGFIERLYADLDSLVVAVGPASFHPQMEVTTAGRLLRQLIEVDAIRTDVQSSFGAGVLAVLLTVVLYFLYKAYRARAGRRLRGRVLLTELARTPVMALLIGLPLLMSLSWAFGVAYLAFGALNLMTSTLGLVLFGLGIDYGIHFYARYTEERGAGHSVAEAAERTFASTGQAIAVGALSTAAALYVLVLADFRGFSEFGVIAGTGVLFALVAMTLVMPALLALFERFRLLDLESGAERRPAARSGGRFPAARGVLLASLALVAAAVVLLPRVSFEY
ncbi:MAG: MMPL family transporter, partial [Rhodothermales bacterium]|nr:MMPL family transporter [Rhodothermales bacterium]